MSPRILLATGLLVAAGRTILACSCLNIQPFCNVSPDPADKRTAIFVGIVKDVYPAESMEDYIHAIYPHLAPGATTVSIEDMKDSLLRVWHGVLSEEEERNIKDAKSEHLEMPLKGMYWSMPRLVHLDVVERFTGVENDTFELFTGIGGGDCGVGFQTGETFLVVAGQDASTGRWLSTICSRTQPIRFADSDLIALRAWKKGKQLKPSVYGTVEDWTDRGNRDLGKPLENLSLELRSDQEKKRATTDSDGHFNFDNLSHKVYELDADLPGWRFARMSDGKRKIDLTKSSCSELFLSMEELQGEVHGKVVGHVQGTREVLWIEAIPTKENRVQSRAGSSKPDGSFVIDRIEPGDYVLAIDVVHPPATENGRNSKYDRITPYPPMFYPGTDDLSRAQVFHLERGQAVNLPPWNLPPPSAERAVKGVILWADRKPAPGAKIILTVASTGVDATGARAVGNDGSFTLFGLEGLEYRIRAAAYEPNEKIYYKGSAEVSKDGRSIIVVLERDGEEPSDRAFFPEP